MPQYRCKECGDDSKTFDTRRQARGHVKFKSGGAHGDAQEIPDSWEEMIEEIEEGNGSGSSGDSESSADGSSGSSDGDTDSGTSGSADGSASDSDGSDGDDDRGIVDTVINTDLRELIRR